MPLKNQPTKKPTKKVIAMSITGAITAGIVTAVNAIAPSFPIAEVMAHAEPWVQSGVASIVTLGAAFVGAYLKRDDA